MKQLVIGADHRGFKLKQNLINNFKSEIEFIDVGCFSEDSVDYPLISQKLAKEVKELNAYGILICGSGVGVCIAANRFNFIRAAVVNSEYVAETSRKHNDINVMCLPADLISEKDAGNFIRIFLATEFLGGHHKKRIEQITSM